MNKKSKEFSKMIVKTESKIEQKRDDIIEEFVKNGVFKIDGKQLYELNLYELMKEYTTEQQ
jgi:hypothetical protein